MKRTAFLKSLGSVFALPLLGLGGEGAPDQPIQYFDMAAGGQDSTGICALWAAEDTHRDINGGSIRILDTAVVRPGEDPRAVVRRLQQQFKIRDPRDIVMLPHPLKWSLL